MSEQEKNEQGACASCGSPSYAGHTADCPANKRADERLDSQETSAPEPENNEKNTENKDATSSEAERCINDIQENIDELEKILEKYNSMEQSGNNSVLAGLGAEVWERLHWVKNSWDDNFKHLRQTADNLSRSEQWNQISSALSERMSQISEASITYDPQEKENYSNPLEDYEKRDIEKALALSKESLGIVKSIFN